MRTVQRVEQDYNTATSLGDAPRPLHLLKRVARPRPSFDLNWASVTPSRSGRHLGLVAAQALSYNALASRYKAPVLCPHSHRLRVPEVHPMGARESFDSGAIHDRQTPQIPSHFAFYAQSGRCFYCGLPMWLTAPSELGLKASKARAFQCTAEHLVAQQDGAETCPGTWWPRIAGATRQAPAEGTSPFR